MIFWVFGEGCDAGVNLSGEYFMIVGVRHVL